jgi:hypothetical protein
MSIGLNRHATCIGAGIFMPFNQIKKPLQGVDFQKVERSAQ